MEKPIVFYRPEYFLGNSYTALFPIDGYSYKRIDISLNDKGAADIKIGIYSKELSWDMTLEAYSNAKKIDVEQFKKVLSDALKKFEL